MRSSTGIVHSAGVSLSLARRRTCRGWPDSFDIPHQNHSVEPARFPRQGSLLSLFLVSYLCSGLAHFAVRRMSIQPFLRARPDAIRDAALLCLGDEYVSRKATHDYTTCDGERVSQVAYQQPRFLVARRRRTLRCTRTGAISGRFAALLGFEICVLFLQIHAGYFFCTFDCFE